MKITVGVLSIRQFFKMKRGAFSALLSLALTLLTLHASHSSILAQDVADAQPDAVDAVPEVLDRSDADRMSVGGGFLHWSFYDNPPRVQSAAPDSASAFGYIKRRPLNGGGSVGYPYCGEYYSTDCPMPP